MPNCCGSSGTCSCLVTAGFGVTVTGAGTAASPYVITGGNGMPSTFQVKTAIYTASVNDFVLANATGGGFTVTLPLSPSIGSLVTVKKTDSSANTVTVVGQGGALIDGDANALIVAEDAGAVFAYDGTNWRIHAVTSYGGGGGVDPGKAPNLLTGSPALGGWWKADALSLSNNDPVPTWTDSSGNSRNLAQATSGKRPTYIAAPPWAGGKPAVRFDGTDDCLFNNSSGLTSGSNYTFFAVVYRQWEATGVGAGSGCIFDGRGTQFLNLSTDPSSNGSVTWRAGNPTGTTSYAGNIAGVFIYIGTYDGAETWGYENFTAKKRTTTLTGAMTLGVLNLGANDAAAGGNSFFPGDIAEAGLYTAALNSTQRIELLRGLSAKYHFAAIA